MSAVLQAVQHDLEAPSDSVPGVEATPSPPGQPDLLTPAALAFLAALHRRFEPTRQQLLAQRRQCQAAYDDGALPDFRADTTGIRDGDWRVAPLPAALLDRRVEITGPVDPKMVINALNSGASCYMADFEASTAPTWANLLTGQQSLHGAVVGTLDFTRPAAQPARQHYPRRFRRQRRSLRALPGCVAGR